MITICVICQQPFTVEKNYKTSYRMHLCESCGKRALDVYPKTADNVLPVQKSIVQYSSDYGYSIKFSFLRIQVYGAFGAYYLDLPRYSFMKGNKHTEKEKLELLLDNFLSLGGVVSKGHKMQEFIRREIEYSMIIFEGIRNDRNKDT